MALIKKRLDQLILERNPHFSRTYIQSLVMQGRVKVNGEVVTKPGVNFLEIADIIINSEEPKYVSRAGYKLEHALKHFNLEVNDLVILDAGLSTGGFTDCLLQHGAKKVYGIDVGYGQVHEKIRKDPRVVVMERTNVRYLEALPEKVDGITLDLSFISVLKVLNAVVAQLKKNGFLLILIKPQFEAERHQMGKGGVITDSNLHQAIVQKIVEGVQKHGLQLVGVVDSPIRGADGNKEFLALFTSHI